LRPTRLGRRGAQWPAAGVRGRLSCMAWMAHRAMVAWVASIGAACGPGDADDGPTGTDDGPTADGTLDAGDASADGSDTGDETGMPACVVDPLDLGTPPSSTRDGTTVAMVGGGPRFEIPAAWLEWHEQFGNNLHL